MVENNNGNNIGSNAGSYTATSLGIVGSAGQINIGGGPIIGSLGNVNL
jgi:hypothetical protein